MGVHHESEYVICNSGTVILKHCSFVDTWNTDFVQLYNCMCVCEWLDKRIKHTVNSGWDSSLCWCPPSFSLKDQEQLCFELLQCETKATNTVSTALIYFPCSPPINKCMIVPLSAEMSLRLLSRQTQFRPVVRSELLPRAAGSTQSGEAKWAEM